MSFKKVLITGGAGFIGKNLSRKLMQLGHSVTIMDCFLTKIHGKNKDLPDDLKQKVRLVKANILDKEKLYPEMALHDTIIHLAAETGTGQSMYEIENYTQTNINGTSIICDFLINEKHNIKSIILASSRSIYGEGRYISPRFGFVYPNIRTFSDISNNFDVTCPITGERNLTLTSTSEDSKIHPSSIYGITKQAQEQMVMMTSKLCGINGIALRYQNVYGPGQSLNNPYTGIISIFTQLAIQNKEINIFEDGLESRDFIFIDDVANITAKCVSLPSNTNLILNVGSGEPTSVIQIANKLKSLLNSKSKIIVSGSFREGDIRHNFADLELLKNTLPIKSLTNINHGLRKFIEWAIMEEISLQSTSYDKSIIELKERGLIKKNDK